MRLALSALGHECIAVGDTLTALGLAEAFEPNLIVYDWNTVSRERVGLSIRLRDRLGGRAGWIAVLSMLHEPVVSARANGSMRTCSSPWFHAI